MSNIEKDLTDILIKATEKSLFPLEYSEKIIDVVMRDGKSSRNEVMNILISYLTESMKERDEMYVALRDLAKRKVGSDS